VTTAQQLCLDLVMDYEKLDFDFNWEEFGEFYVVGTRVRFIRVGQVFIGRVLRDQPWNRRCLVRYECRESGKHVMRNISLMQSYIPYRYITGVVSGDA